jgi:hypothetical protein
MHLYWGGRHPGSDFLYGPELGRYVEDAGRSPRAGAIEDAFTESVDVMPTIIEWLGGEATADDAQMVADLATDLADEARAEDFVLRDWISNRSYPITRLWEAANGDAAALAEVRRVVEGVKECSIQETAGCANAPLACDAILAEIERL